MTAADWFRNEIIKGIMALKALNLSFSPPEDVVQATAKVWVNSLSRHPIAWDRDQDSERIRSAFQVLSVTSKSWPSPAQFLEALPARKPVLAITHKTGNTMPPEVRSKIDAFLGRARA